MWRILVKVFDLKVNSTIPQKLKHLFFKWMDSGKLKRFKKDLKKINKLNPNAFIEVISSIENGTSSIILVYIKTFSMFAVFLILLLTNLHTYSFFQMWKRIVFKSTVYFPNSKGFSDRFQFCFSVIKNRVLK